MYYFHFCFFFFFNSDRPWLQRGRLGLHKAHVVEDERGFEHEKVSVIIIKLVDEFEHESTADFVHRAIAELVPG